MNFEDFIILFGICLIGGMFIGGLLALGVLEKNWGELVDEKNTEIKKLKAQNRALHQSLLDLQARSLNAVNYDWTKRSER
ncbi:hypothetical protein [Priestia megaterium]|uniref:hypothetical protein n=1 Tax=Priestia megaterium TaxID=1404 RepID=UPI002E1E6562|nr:hypothetical protein [Priestia megaterium]